MMADAPLIHHLPVGLAVYCILGSALRLDCFLVEATSTSKSTQQQTAYKLFMWARRFTG
jgi:hypothetical protein